MNIQQLRTLAAILEEQSFSAAARKIGLSHSAISLQIKSLEAEFGRELFDRGSRPPKFTAAGHRTAEMAKRALRSIEEVRLVGSGNAPLDEIAIGVVPTILQDILPLILGQIQEHHPDLQMTVRSGLSGDLTSQVINSELDMAIVTSPAASIPEIVIEEIASEPLFAISDKTLSVASDEELLKTRPFIGFSRKTWLGQQISARLQTRGIFINEIMEVNSLDAIEKMVSEGYGVSIVPQRFLAKSLSENLNCLPFCDPQEVRRLVLIHRANDKGNEPLKLMLNIVASLISRE